MPVIKYEDFKEKVKNKQYLNQEELDNVQELRDLFQSLDQNRNSEFYGKLGNYREALTMLTRPWSINDLDIRKNLQTLNGLNEFLFAGEGKTNYQKIVAEAQKLNKIEKETINKGLKAASDYAGLGVDVNNLDGMEIEAEKGPVPLDTPEKVKDSALNDPSSFMNSNNNNQKNLRKFIWGLEKIAEEKLEYKNKYAQTEEQRIKKQSEIKLGEDLQKQVKAMSYLLNNTTYIGISDDVLKAHINTLQGLQSFLKDGKERTNYQRIADACGNGKNDKKLTKAELDNGLKILEDTLHFGIDAKEAQQAQKTLQEQIDTYKSSPEKDAATWIEQYKKDLKVNKSSVLNNPDKLKDAFAKIMAARMISNSEPGDLSTLRMNMKEPDIQEKVKELKQNGEFNKFLERITTEPKLIEKAFAAATKSPGHGGGLDKMMKDYLKNKPAGELNNDPALDRYMPTALERIETLKKRAEAVQKKGKSPYAEAAEILTLRNMVRADRKDKSSLDKKIPTTGTNLSETVNSLSGEVGFQLLMTDPRVSSNVTKGHGGAMIDNMRLAYNTSEIKNKDVEKALKANTIGGRLEQIKVEAEALRDKLLTAGTNEKANLKLNGDAFKLTAEMIALCTRIPKAAKGLEDNIPWGKVNDLAESAGRNISFGSLFSTTNNSINQMTDIMTDGPIGYIDKNKNKIWTEEATKLVTDPKTKQKVQQIYQGGPGMQI